MSSPMIVIVIVAIGFIFVVYRQNSINRNFDYQCGNCGNQFSLPAWKGALLPHSMGRKLVRCPNVGKFHGRHLYAKIWALSLYRYWATQPSPTVVRGA